MKQKGIQITTQDKDGQTRTRTFHDEGQAQRWMLDMGRVESLRLAMATFADGSMAMYRRTPSCKWEQVIRVVGNGGTAHRMRLPAPASAARQLQLFS